MVDIIAVTYGQNEILKCFINSIKSQTNNNWRLVIIHDGPNPTLHNELNQNILNLQFFYLPHQPLLAYNNYPR